MPIPPDPSVLLTELLDHLVTQGLVRRPSATTPIDLPKMYLKPKGKLPAPNAVDAPATIGVWGDGGIPAQPFESSLTTDKVEFVVRTTKAHDAQRIYDTFRDELVDRRNWQMGNWTISHSQEWRKLRHRGSDDDSYVDDFAVLFTTYA